MLLAMPLALAFIAFAIAAEDPAPAVHPGQASAATQLASPTGVEEEMLGQLLTIRRVFVDRLSGGDTAVQIRDMIVAAMQGTKLFVITENQERADAFLRGSAEDLVFTDEHSSSDSIHANANFGLGGSGATGSRTSRGGRSSEYQGLGVGESESSRSSERRHEAVAAVRLVNKDGDVVWSTTQESLGGKFRGSGADVADKIMRKLLEDYARAKKLKQP
jgi:hypothetical protein